MNPADHYNQTKRVICPHCKGDKIVPTTIEVLHPRKYETIKQRCPVCGGEAVVNMTITYEKITK